MREAAVKPPAIKTSESRATRISASVPPSVMPLCGPLPGPPPVPGGLHGTPLVGVPLHVGSVGVGVLPVLPLPGVGDGATGGVVGVGDGAAGGVVGVGDGATGGVVGVGDGAAGGVVGVGDGAAGGVVGVGDGAAGGVVGVGDGVTGGEVGDTVGVSKARLWVAVAVALTETKPPGVFPATATSAKQHERSKPATIIKITARLRTPPCPPNIPAIFLQSCLIMTTSNTSYQAKSAFLFPPPNCLNSYKVALIWFPPSPLSIAQLAGKS
jgi:hypothetical protein